MRDYEDSFPRNKNTTNKTETQIPKPKIPPIIIRKAMEHSLLCKIIQGVIKSDNFHIKHTAKNTQIMV